MAPWHREGAAAGLVALGASLVVTWPLAQRPRQLLGHPLGESDNHLRMLWASRARLLGESSPLENLPQGHALPLMDPINLPAYLAGAWADPVLGYNLVLLSNLVLACLAAWWLARELGGGRIAGLTAGVAALTAPTLGGLISFGITEALPVGWIAVHCAAMLAWLRTGRWRWSLLGAAALVAYVLAGWYHAVFALALGVVWVPSLLRRAPGRWAGSLGAWALAGVALLPHALNFISQRGLWSHRWGSPEQPPAGLAESWRHTPAFGTDLLNLVLPAVAKVPVSKSAYLGVVVLLLALAAGRRARPLWAMAAPLLVLALGHWLVVAGHPLFSLPARWLVHLVPPLEGLSHWHRAAATASLLLAVAAGLGLERLSSNSTRRAAPLLTLLALDALLLSQTPWPQQVYPVELPTGLQWLADQAPGGVVLLPFDNGRREFDATPPRLYERWQVRLERPISENYEGPDALLRGNRLVAAADGLCGLSEQAWQHGRVPPDMRRVEALSHPGAMLAARTQLARSGVTWVVLLRDRAPTAQAASELLKQGLGTPVHATETVEIYGVPAP